MRQKLLLFILLSVSFKCNAQLPKLSDILMGAHENVRTGINNVASAVIGGLTHGLNFNFEGRENYNNRPGYKNRHPQVPNNGGAQGKPDNYDTVVVIVEEDSNQNNYESQRPNQFRPPHQPPHAYRPHRPNFNRPHNGYNHHHHYHHHNRPNFPGQYKPGYNDPNEYNQNNCENSSENNYENSNEDNYGTPNHDKPTSNKPSSNGGHETTTGINEHNLKPTTSTNTDSTNSGTEETTKKPVDDQPVFVPLNPDQYTYGGDKINITAPKRDTNDKKEPAESDEDFPIDIRFKDE